MLTGSFVGYPSPMDRVRATRLAVKCVQWLEDPEIREGCTSAVIGIRGGNVVFSDSETLEVQETDFETRRPKVAWWSGLKKVGTTLSTKPLSPDPSSFFACCVGSGSNGRWS